MHFNNLTVLIISYKSDPELLKCLDNLRNLKQIIIFDNSNDIILKKKIEKKYPYINFFLSKKNLGYGSANNILLKKVKTKYCLLLNPDSRIRSKNILKMLEFAKKINNFFLITPNNKSYKLKDYFIDYKNSEFFMNKSIIEIDSTHFYAPLINMERLNKNNLFFDEKYFLYYEDMDLCLRIKKKNEKIFLLKNVYADHFFGKSSKKIDYDLLRSFHWGWSTVYFYKKHFSIFFYFFKISFLILKSFLALLFYKIINDQEKSDFIKSRLSGIFDAFYLNKDYQRTNY
jgi:N-acetylglucosaminyl-diphospho-decaprenol L-rhamnosyltransferase